MHTIEIIAIITPAIPPTKAPIGTGIDLDGSQ